MKRWATARVRQIGSIGVAIGGNRRLNVRIRGRSIGLDREKWAHPRGITRACPSDRFELRVTGGMAL